LASSRCAPPATLGDVIATDKETRAAVTHMIQEHCT